MKLYIDPGTGSMLFAILIGIIGALNFALRGWIIKLRFLLSGGEKTAVDQEKHPLAVFVDDKRYWNVMEPVCRELDRRGLDVAYLTASPDDPALQNPYAHVHAEFLGEGNKAFAKLNFLRANVLLSTTPGLDVYQWKRSPSVDCYVHILHAANEVAGYRMFGIDYYDTVFVSGDYQIRDLRALEALRDVDLPAPEEIYRKYPHECSGGQLQRVMIAAAIVTDPHLLLLDEPTTALDVTVQAQILALLRRLNRERGISMLLISHNLQVVRRICSRVAVMQRGHIVEEGAPEQLFTAPQHPYTAELINAIPRRVRRG